MTRKERGIRAMREAQKRRERLHAAQRSRKMDFAAARRETAQLRAKRRALIEDARRALRALGELSVQQQHANGGRVALRATCGRCGVLVETAQEHRVLWGTDRWGNVVALLRAKHRKALERHLVVCGLHNLQGENVCH